MTPIIRQKVTSGRRATGHVRAGRKCVATRYEDEYSYQCRVVESSYDPSIKVTD